MDVMQAMQERHSVRNYTEKMIPEDVAAALKTEIEACNRESGLHMQIVFNEEKAFDGFMAHYGKFSGVRNYIALIGPKGKELDEKIGYYGERVVLKAQTLGLNTCWVAATFKKGETKKHCEIGKEEKLVCVVALGYGATQGIPHKNKPIGDIFFAAGETPDWFQKGLTAALSAPTAMNQQKFRIGLAGRKVTIKKLSGFYTSLDLGIVKYHFEIGAGRENFEWAE